MFLPCSMYVVCMRSVKQSHADDRMLTAFGGKKLSVYFE